MNFDSKLEKSQNNSFQAMHSPRGANASFVMGMYGKGGGFALEKERVPNQDIFIGIHDKGTIKCLPFFEKCASLAKDSFVKSSSCAKTIDVEKIPNEEIKRYYGWSTDRWEAPGICFEIMTPVHGVPDPSTAEHKTVKDAIAPSVATRLTIDNTNGGNTVQGFFAVDGLRGKVFLEDATKGELCGITTTDGYGFAVDLRKYSSVKSVADFDLFHLFGRKEPIKFSIGPMGGLVIDVPARSKVTVDIVLGWYKPGIVTRGEHNCSYYYTRFFKNLNEVLKYALTRVEDWFYQAGEDDIRLETSGINEHRQFMLAHATRAYYASTMLFDEGGNARWVVNEGTYMMMNTLDLTVDHVFFELENHPWAVRSQLDSFADEYSYYDKVHFPGEPEKSYDGGISFCHDQGTHHTFSPKSYSSYEISDQEGCFSYMTQEQLCNWILCASLYVHKTNNRLWLGRRLEMLSDCLDSMLNRDHPEPEKRDGIMDLVSNRCGISNEITTYDSLDHSLGYATRNLYIAVKCWACYIALETLFSGCDDRNYKAKADIAKDAAVLCAKTITSYYDKKLGYIPSILNGRDKSAIISAIEGLVYPLKFGRADTISIDGEYGTFIKTLKNHFENILKPGLCMFSAGGWKLSRNSDNSWISKIFLCQYIAEKVFELEPESSSSDIAHENWWKVGCAESPGIDQIIAGRVWEVGFHYPRAVTSILWLDK